jgi:hypothetical protein
VVLIYSVGWNGLKNNVMGKTREEQWDIVQTFCKLRVPDFATKEGGLCYKLRGNKLTSQIMGKCVAEKCPILNLLEKE